MQALALVIGATGAFGGETAQALLRCGWRVRALHRDPDRARAASDLALDWVKGDAMAGDDVRRAAEGARVIVHAANPPGYRNWKGLALPMLESAIAAARAEGARILLPGNVYNYGPDAFPRLSEASPQHPLTRKGAIRVAMEQRLAQAAQEGAKVLILRAGDFFGARGAASWMGSVMFQAGKPVRSLSYPGPLGVRHAWAYLPDLAETAARLLMMEAELAAHASFHFAGHALTGRELRAGFEAAVGHRLPIRPFPWFALPAVAPFNETLRELLEMRYLWRDEVVLDNARLVATLGAEPHTPIEIALDETLRALGCLPPVELVRAA
ncbi:NAD-dependent epimerase/dehydratase family protein [Phenylobacterium sp.]|uniref:NAD-dependent epimerase/dehydratase family protein n=1 Tax=Phenylobacterium sp. TaxID=1871053 RepID=UPI00262829FE|nr:NAD-dependent epimerase/dehydratase family protein [Phenylobacterium sp.]